MFHSARSMRTANALGSKLGRDTMRKNLAVARIHGDNRAIAIAQCQLRSFLQVVVDGQLQVLPGNRVLRPRKPTSRPWLSTITSREPSCPRSTWSYISSTPPLPTTSPGSYAA